MKFQKNCPRWDENNNIKIIQFEVKINFKKEKKFIFTSNWRKGIKRKYFSKETNMGRKWFIINFV
jgi:hypothetical protein